MNIDTRCYCKCRGRGVGLVQVSVACSTLTRDEVVEIAQMKFDTETVEDTKAPLASLTTLCPTCCLLVD